MTNKGKSIKKYIVKMEKEAARRRSDYTKDMAGRALGLYCDSHDLAIFLMQGFYPNHIIEKVWGAANILNEAFEELRKMTENEEKGDKING